jgi:starvation-inducible DNA-binding protein
MNVVIFFNNCITSRGYSELNFTGLNHLQYLKIIKMETNIGITADNRKAVAIELGKLLADEYVLITKTRNAHWNTEGIHFYEKHKFFEAQYEQIDVLIDKVAERIRMVGHYAIASLKSFLEQTHLSETTPENNESMTYIKELLIDHESIIIHCRENIHLFANECHDMGSSDFITGIMEEHEQMAWFLRSHIK